MNTDRMSRIGPVVAMLLMGGIPCLAGAVAIPASDPSHGRDSGPSAWMSMLGFGPHLAAEGLHGGSNPCNCNTTNQNGPCPPK